MNKIKDFDSVQFQRDVRESMLKEANYDLDKLVNNIKKRLTTNDLYIFFKERKEKEKQLDTV
ncbi:MAG: hypothetical protein A2X61_01275 [Ignavibacteria bacterium GWB2_35_12]|nr:MAG: hypothetical protein A2X63_13595 [Ignavibacteria bacterium GWA2_35_8]OGU42041.1 MAG: hypothetical protein A2X61_01275 [Ignavibacteria bacterium GWB2_35_12]OGU93239.1 MAG: hypothetical protein A2220_02555 [Ignavibacteria bacterium RIFOXYA2_FULL_35_10]OGV18718.1 MAG: hypothetical protein A2475_08895 [Ignavibacteria bacterium RIFOXYC2_FULL_35_21]